MAENTNSNDTDLIKSIYAYAEQLHAEQKKMRERFDKLKTRLAKSKESPEKQKKVVVKQVKHVLAPTPSEPVPIAKRTTVSMFDF